MTSTEVQPTNSHTAERHAPAQASHVGQATVVEQARAVAEVQAAIVVAQQCPRSVSTAVSAMQESCAQNYLAERAFFRYNRAGSQITGPSVHLARELARCWGNVQYGIAELRRDDKAGESEMQAYAWDVQTNTRSVSVFVVKHVRDTTKGTKNLTDQRDIYENNANMGARRLREAIFAILPTWFTEQAKDVCNKTLRDGGGEPMPTRIANALQAFSRLGVTQRQLEDKLGRKKDDWIAGDVAQLQVVHKSITTGEARIEDEFPTQRVTTGDIVDQKPAKQNARVSAADITGPADPPPADDTDPDPSDADLAAIARGE